MDRRGFSLRWQLLLTFGSVMTLALVLLVATLSARAGALLERQAMAHVEALARGHAAEIEGELERVFATARGVAQAVEASARSGTADRAAADSLLAGVLRADTTLLGTWLGYEPDAFDGRDAAHRDAPRHDETGRFFPGWVREDDGVVVPDVAPVEHEYEVPGEGDWYLEPRATLRETVLEPYFYPVAGTEVLMTSLAVPLLRDGRFAGVAGVDISLAALQQRLSTIRPYGTGSVALISAGGSWVAHPDASRLGAAIDSATADRLAAALAEPAASARRTPLQDGTEAISVYVPLRLGQGDARWVFAATVPRATVLAEAAQLRSFILLFGLVTLLALGVVIHLVALRITRPISELAEVATAVARGSVEQDVAIRAGGEIGRLAASFGDVVHTMRALTTETRGLVQAAAAARLDHRADAAPFAGAYRELVLGMNQTMDALAGLTRQAGAQRDEALAFLEDTRAVLACVSRGELTAQLNGHYHGAYGEIADALNATLARLRALVDEMRATTETVAANAVGIGSGSGVIAQVAESTREDAHVMAQRSQHVGESVRLLADSAGAMSQRTRDLTASSRRPRR